MTDDDDDLMFGDEDADAGDSPADTAPSWKLLIVDDEEEVHEVTRLALGNFRFAERSITFLHAYSGAEACRIMAEQDDIAMLLLDVVMETEHAGLDVVRYIREELGNRLVRIILRTGQPGQAPERRVITDYDINDYKEKTELTARKLFTTVYTGLSAYRDMLALECNRRGLKKVIDASADIFLHRSLDQFTQGVLQQLAALLYLGQDAMLVHSAGMAVTGPAGNLEVLAAVGCYSDARGQRLDRVLDQPLVERVTQALAEGHDLFEGNTYVGYFRASSGDEIALLITADVPPSVTDRALISLFCRNVSLALDNLRYRQADESTRNELLACLGEAIEMRDARGSQHVRRMGEYAARLGQLAGLDDDAVAMLRSTAPLHDIGKAVIEEGILLKPGALSDEEWKIMQGHASIGAEMLGRHPGLLFEQAAEIARQHHEHFDGSGYPEGLAGRGISLAARVVAIADSFDALTAERPQRPARSVESAEQWLQEQAGQRFDPELVQLWLDNREAFRAIRQDWPDQPTEHG